MRQPGYNVGERSVRKNVHELLREDFLLLAVHGNGLGQYSWDIIIANESSSLRWRRGGLLLRFGSRGWPRTTYKFGQGRRCFNEMREAADIMRNRRRHGGIRFVEEASRRRNLCLGEEVSLLCLSTAHLLLGEMSPKKRKNHVFMIAV